MTTTTCETTTAPTTESWYRYFSPPQWIVFGALILLGILFRWILLDMRPYHHDESLHGMYGRYFYDFPNQNFYKYDPMLHGPMLYNSMRFIYAMFGDSLWAARTPVAMMGTLFIFAPFIFRRYFSRSSVIALTAAVAISPTMVYWSRFLREDFWVVSGMLLSVYGLTLARGNMKAFFVLLGITIQWCTKENVFVTLAIVFGYLAFEAFMERFILRQDNHENLFERLVAYFARYTVGTLVSVFVCALIYSWFYGAGFRFPQGIIDGLGGKGFEYWAKHHGMERIQGPFNFHLYVLGWYELPFMAAFLTHVVLFYRHAHRTIQFCGAFVLTAAVLTCTAHYLDLRSGQNLADSIRLSEVWKLFKLKDHFDLFGLFLLLFHSPLVVIQHFIRRERVLASTGYFFTSAFFVYSYLGEKVPWLSIYPYVFGLPYLALFFEDYFKKHPVDYRNYPISKAMLWTGVTTIIFGVVFVIEILISTGNFTVSPEDTMILCVGVLLVTIALIQRATKIASTTNISLVIGLVVALYSVRATIQTNFLYPGKETEFLSQVHTTYEIAELAKQISSDVIYQPDAYKPKVYVDGDATWPLTWYFRGLKENYRFTDADAQEKSKFTYLVQDWNDEVKNNKIPEGFISRRVNLRGWWVPDYRQMTLKKFLRYSINHYPWSPTGFTYVIVSVAKDAAAFKEAYTED